MLFRSEQLGHPRSVDGIAICGGVCGVEVEQWWSTMVDIGGAG